MCFDRAWTDRICSLTADDDDDGADMFIPALPPLLLRVELGTTRSLRELRGKLLPPDIDDDSRTCSVHRAPQKISHANEILADKNAAQDCKIPGPEILSSTSFGPIYQPVNDEVWARGTGGLGCNVVAVITSTHDVPLTGSVSSRLCQDCPVIKVSLSGHWGISSVRPSRFSLSHFSLEEQLGRIWLASRA